LQDAHTKGTHAAPNQLAPSRDSLAEIQTIGVNPVLLEKFDKKYYFTIS
jgi:hypothetical protein